MHNQRINGIKGDGARREGVLYKKRIRLSGGIDQEKL